MRLLAAAAAAAIVTIHLNSFLSAPTMKTSTRTLNFL
jgi:hypothetical protein